MPTVLVAAFCFDMLSWHAQAMQIIASAIQACGKFQFKSDLYKPQVYADFQLVDYTLISSALPSAESWR